MNEQKHTPGPWEMHMTADRIEIRMGSRVGGGNPYQPHHEFEVCELFDLDDEQKDEVIANASLTAASPDLLAACQAVLETAEESFENGELAIWSDAVGELSKIVEAAIAKATGGAA
jgi:hypothetical protein